MLENLVKGHEGKYTFSFMVKANEKVFPRKATHSLGGPAMTLRPVWQVVYDQTRVAMKIRFWLKDGNTDAEGRAESPDERLVQISQHIPSERLFNERGEKAMRINIGGLLTKRAFMTPDREGLVCESIRRTYRTAERSGESTREYDEGPGREARGSGRDPCAERTGVL